MQGARIDEVSNQLVEVFKFKPSDMRLISAKTGLGVPELIVDVIQQFPAP
jgi:translation elongation factor EF-4